MKTDKPHATLWIARLTEPRPDDDDREDENDPEYLRRIEERIRERYPRIVHESMHGDMLENSTVAGYRSEGVFMIAKANEFRIVALERGVDDYGSVSQEFEAIINYPLDYWEYNRMQIMSMDGGSATPASYWHGPTALLKVGDVRAEATRVEIAEGGVKFLFHGTEYIIRHISSLDELYDTYNGFVYCISATTGTTEP
jgi:hypothetical protein